ncbi:MAG: VCBS repeat-containing protein, partial [Verrucomicrobia bacterium]|nr:VCBS repeat-containing protein [Verrucomicrobiota bacterium]
MPSQIPSSDPPDSGGSFYRALLLLATAVLVILGIFASGYWKRNPAGPTLAPVNPPDPARPDVEIIPDTPFADVTSESGVTFVHFNGAAGEKLLPETMGAGVAIFDANHDGLQDLLFANGADWSWTQARKASVPTPELWLNQGGMTFSNSTVSSGLAFSMQGTGVAVGDYDNDGKTDVFLSGVGTLRLLRNIGNGRFEDVTAGSGLHLGVEDWASSAAFLDYDNDGDLDLFACLYVRWSREIDISVDYRLVGVGRAYGPPNNFPGNYPRLWQNLGDGRFRDVSVQAGLRMLNKATGEPVAKSLGVSPVDLDRDGWMDLVVANDTVQNFVFHNERNGTFKEIGAASGIAFDSYGS